MTKEDQEYDDSRDYCSVCKTRTNANTVLGRGQDRSITIRNGDESMEFIYCERHLLMAVMDLQCAGSVPDDTLSITMVKA